MKEDKLKTGVDDVAKYENEPLTAAIHSGSAAPAE